MSTSKKGDLATIRGLHAYLADTPFASDNIMPLSGGTANFVFRVELKVPYEGCSTLVVKHAKSFVLASSQQLSVELYRQHFEVEALNRVKAILSKDQIVRVPNVHLFDKDAHIIIMDDCGKNAVNLKQFCQEGNLSLSLAENIGRELGEFLWTLHGMSREDPSILSFFEGNQQAKTISAFATYGRLVSTLSNQDNLSALSEPPLEIPEKDLEVIKQLSSETTSAILAARDYFVMGDFWPGNILIAVSEQNTLESIHIVDWELAKPGLPALDVGQFCAEMHLLRHFHPECAQSAGRAISAFLEGYSHVVRPGVLLLRTALVHLGAHLVAWTPRVGWGGKERTREAVLGGTALLVGGYSGTEEMVELLLQQYAADLSIVRKLE